MKRCPWVLAKVLAIARVARTRRARRYLVVLLAVLLLYVGSYLVWTRRFPARIEAGPEGTQYYAFVSADPDWEHTLVAVYYQLVRLDGWLLGLEHRFYVDFF